MGKPLAILIRTAGTNCDAELARAFELAGAEARLVHVDALIAEPGLLGEAELIGIPGGFSYGDDIASGRILAMRLREKLWAPLRAAAERGVPMIGVCNGFQVLVQVGLLPGVRRGEAWPADGPPAARVALTDNAQARFVDRWVGVRAEPGSACIWTSGLVGNENAETMMLPIAHAEGRFVTSSPQALAELDADRQVALRYAPGENPNGSAGDVAGICDASGRIFGLMPHPERYLDWTHHPFWTRLGGDMRSGETPGLVMFRNAVEAVGRREAIGNRQ